MLRTVLGVIAALQGCAAPTPGAVVEDGVDAVAIDGAKADGTSFTECELDAVVVHANDPSTDVGVLLAEGVGPNAAQLLVEHRDGPDTIALTDDDDPFDDILEVDAVDYVGESAMRALVGAAGEGCTAPPASGHLAAGVPTDTTPDDEYRIERTQYVLSYNPILNVANWASWRLVDADFGPVPRRDGFETDTSLPDGFYRVTTNDYTGTGYDRGHIVRSEERTATDEDNAATFLMTNIMPQTAYLNRGPWVAFEKFLQGLVQRKGDTLYVMAGPVLDSRCMTHAPRQAGDGCPDLGRSSDPTRRVPVPVATFKIAVVVKPGRTLADVTSQDIIAVIMPNEGDIRANPWTDYLTTVEEIEARTGYRFLDAIRPTGRERGLRELPFSTSSEHAELLREDDALVVGCGFVGDACEEALDCCSDICGSDGVCE